MGQSAREICGETPQPSTVSRLLSRASPTSGAVASTSSSSAVAPKCVSDAWGNRNPTSESGFRGNESSDLGVQTQKLEEASERTMEADLSCGIKFQEEVINKLEQLGYP